MSQIVIAVASTRKPKLAAVRDALEQIGPLLAPDAQFELAPRQVESGVAHTPSSRRELMQGARRRAESLLAAAKKEGHAWNYFVGLEGGLDSVEESLRRRVFLQSWAYATDGTRGYYGASGAIEVPEPLAAAVLIRGIELSTAIDEFAQQSGIRDAQGAWGVLSANNITRQDSFRIALIAAFAPFYNARFYDAAIVRNSAVG